MHKIKGLLSIFCRQAQRLCFPLILGHVPQIYRRQRELQRRMDHLGRLPINNRETSTPCLVAPENLVKTLLESTDIERAWHMNGDTLVIDRSIRYQLGEQPQLLLPKRQGYRFSRGAPG